MTHPVLQKWGCSWHSRQGGGRHNGASIGQKGFSTPPQHLRATGTQYSTRVGSISLFQHILICLYIPKLRPMRHFDHFSLHLSLHQSRDFEGPCNILIDTRPQASGSTTRDFTRDPYFRSSHQDVPPIDCVSVRSPMRA